MFSHPMHYDISASGSGSGHPEALHSMPLRRPMDRIRSKYRTKICQKYVRGECKYGDRCKFLHPTHPEYQKLSASRNSPPVSLLNRSAESLPAHHLFPPQPPLVTGPFTDHATHTFGGQLPESPIQSSLVSGRSNEPNQPRFVSAHHTIQPSSHLPVKPVSWRTAPCKHFVRNRGWCPHGDDCNYIHDLSLPHQSTVNDGQSSTSTTAVTHRLLDDHSDSLHDNSYRIIGGGVFIGSRPAHCWAHVQGGCQREYCRYFHPKDVRPYIKYTPCLKGRDCQREMCGFQHPWGRSEHSVTSYFPSAASNNLNARILPPYGSYEVQGTTYFLPPVTSDLSWPLWQPGPSNDIGSR